MYASHLRMPARTGGKIREQNSLVLAQNFLDGADLFFAHGGHHCQDHVLSLIKPTLDLQAESAVI
jgi:hypothetical protein